MPGSERMSSRSAHRFDPFSHAEQAKPFSPRGLHVEAGAIVADGQRDVVWRALQVHGHVAGVT